MDAAQMKDIEDRLKSKPQSPNLSPDEKKATIAAYRQVSQDRKDLLKRLLQHPCSYCEGEFKVPNVGLSHGICPRHKDQVYREMGMEPKPSQYANKTVDLKELSPEEIKLAVNLFSILRAKRNAERSKADAAGSV